MTNILALIGRKRIKELESELAQERFARRKTHIKLVSRRAAVRHLQHKIEVLEAELRLKDSQLNVAQFDIDKLKEALAVPAYVRSSEPLWLSEPEEDELEQARLEAEDMLRQLDFENADIEFDTDDEIL